MSELLYTSFVGQILLEKDSIEINMVAFSLAKFDAFSTVSVESLFCIWIFEETSSSTKIEIITFSLVFLEPYDDLNWIFDIATIYFIYPEVFNQIFDWNDNNLVFLKIGCKWFCCDGKNFMDIRKFVPIST